MAFSSNNPSAPPSRGNLSSSRGGALLGVLILLSVTLYGAIPQYALDTSGQRTTGTLTDIYARPRAGWFVNFRYQVGNQTFSGDCGVKDGDFHSDQVGGPVTVVYLPDHPNISRTEPSNAALYAYEWFWLVVVIACVTFVVFGIDFLKRRSGQTDRPSA